MKWETWFSMDWPQTSARYFSICDRVLYRAYVVHTADGTAQFL